MLKLVLFLASKHVSLSQLSQVQVMIIESCLMRGDRKRAEQDLIDWGITKAMHITKWNPGDHYYVGGEKFNTYQEAKEHLISEGYVFAGFKERRIG